MFWSRLSRFLRLARENRQLERTVTIQQNRILNLLAEIEELKRQLR